MLPMVLLLPIPHPHLGPYHISSTLLPNFPNIPLPPNVHGSYSVQGTTLFFEPPVFFLPASTFASSTFFSHLQEISNSSSLSILFLGLRIKSVIFKLCCKALNDLDLTWLDLGHISCFPCTIHTDAHLLTMLHPALAPPVWSRSH